MTGASPSGPRPVGPRRTGGAPLSLLEELTARGGGALRPPGRLELSTAHAPVSSSKFCQDSTVTLVWAGRRKTTRGMEAQGGRRTPPDPAFFRGWWSKNSVCAGGRTRRATRTLTEVAWGRGGSRRRGKGVKLYTSTKTKQTENVAAAGGMYSSGARGGATAAPRLFRLPTPPVRSRPHSRWGRRRPGGWSGRRGGRRPRCRAAAATSRSGPRPTRGTCSSRRRRRCRRSTRAGKPASEDSPDSRTPGGSSPERRSAPLRRWRWACRKCST